MNDVIPEMHASFGLRPCLSNPALSASGAVVSMEADVGAAAAMLALRLFTGDSPFYTEPFSADYASNAVLMGHAGYHDTVNADPAGRMRIINDVEYENSDRFTGAANFLQVQAGPRDRGELDLGRRGPALVLRGRRVPSGARKDGRQLPPRVSARRSPCGSFTAGWWTGASPSTGCSFPGTARPRSSGCAVSWECASCPDCQSRAAVAILSRRWHGCRRVTVRLYEELNDFLPGRPERTAVLRSTFRPGARSRR